MLYQVQKNVELLENLQTQLELEKNSRKEVTFLEKAAFWVGYKTWKHNRPCLCSKKYKRRK